MLQVQSEPASRNVFEDSFVAFRRRIMSSNTAEIAIEAPLTSNPLDVVPSEIPFDVPYGIPISLEQAQAVIQAAVAEAKKRNWKMNVAVADSGGNLVAFQRMDGAMLASIQIAEHKARAAVTFRRPTKVFEDGTSLCVSTICSRLMESLRLGAAFHSSTRA
jgi:hypothetical protein